MPPQIIDAAEALMPFSASSAAQAPAFDAAAAFFAFSL